MSIARATNEAFLRLQIRALLLFAQRRRALESVEALLDLRSDNPYALATQAHLLAELGDRSAAQGALQRLVAVQPDQAPGWFNLGFLSEEMGQLEVAEAAFRRALDIDPTLADGTSKEEPPPSAATFWQKVRSEPAAAIPNTVTVAPWVLAFEIIVR